MEEQSVQHETPASPYFGIERDKVELIKNTVAESATSDELRLFLYHVSRSGLDPLARQIYFQKRFNKKRHRFEMTVITGIDGYRLVADRTGQYAGNDDPIFDDEASPRKATVTVYKFIGNIRCPFTASARWEQYYPGDEQGFMWRKMPHLMLGKCAEALALRKAFPAELSGIYIKEEMDQADNEVSSVSEEAKPNEFKTKGELKTQSKKANEAAPVYSGTEHQRNVLRRAFAEQKLSNRDKHAIAAAMQGKPMDILDQVISDYLHNKPEEVADEKPATGKQHSA